MFVIERVHRWWTQRLLRKHRIPITIWRQVVSISPLLQRLDSAEQHRLRELASLFLLCKEIVGAKGFVLDDAKRTLIAAQASLLILNLGLKWYDGWSEIIVYADAFIAPQHERDEAGVVHDGVRGLSGEAWGRGPVILAWAEIDPARGGRHAHGYNVVLHEFAHKLDLRDGAANGIPPLHAGNTPQAWARDFSRAYAEFGTRLQTTAIDPYAATNPAEFFAVMTELFFEEPQRLQRYYPMLYSELRHFYCQDPIKRYGEVRGE